MRCDECMRFRVRLISVSSVQESRRMLYRFSLLYW